MKRNFGITLCAYIFLCGSTSYGASTTYEIKNSVTNPNFVVSGTVVFGTCNGKYEETVIDDSIWVKRRYGRQINGIDNLKYRGIIEFNISQWQSMNIDYNNIEKISLVMNYTYSLGNPVPIVYDLSAAEANGLLQKTDFNSLGATLNSNVRLEDIYIKTPSEILLYDKTSGQLLTNALLNNLYTEARDWTGFVLISSDEGINVNTEVDFAGDNNYSIGPSLVITYNQPEAPAVPEPGTIILMSFCGILVFRRKR